MKRIVGSILFALFMLMVMSFNVMADLIVEPEEAANVQTAGGFDMLLLALAACMVIGAILIVLVIRFRGKKG